MEMTELQIASEYRTGKDKTNTIKVLADLNLCSQRQIAEILQEQGEELPKAWKDKLAVPLKRPPRGKPATRQDINDAVLVAAMGKSSSGRGDPSTPLRSAQDDSVKARADAFRQEPAALLPVPAPAALSLDEIRQAALELILNHSPGEAVRFQGYVLGMAALVDKLGEKLEAKTT